MQISRRCPFIQHQVETRVKCFFPKLEYQEIAASLIGASFGRYEPNSIFRYRSVKCLKESPCYIVYCPSIWTENIESLLLDIQKVLSAEGFVLLVEAGTMQDYFNTVDALQKKTGMNCVMDQVLYQGTLPMFLGKSLVFLQFWLKTKTVSVNNWVQY